MDWMHLLFAAAATGFGGLAWGYRTQAANEREQITYLRKQLGAGAPPSEPHATGSTPPTRLPVPHQGGGQR